MSAPTLARPFPLHHFNYLSDRTYRRLFTFAIRKAIHLGVRFEIEWQHDGGCCTLQPQAISHENLIDQLTADGIVIWKVDAR